MNHYTHWSPCALQHVLPALAQDWIANGHHEPIGSWRSFRAWLGLDVPDKTQGSKHGDAGHKLIGRTAVVEETEHGIALRSDGISNRAAMAAGSEDQPTVWHQLWDATAKGTATR
jgi:hypothetical protein